MATASMRSDPVTTLVVALAAEHLHLIGDDLGDVAFIAVTVVL
jgi:hypothetical protein